VKPLIYLIGPYRRPEPVANVNRAVRIGQQIRDTLDVAVIIPHWSMLEHLICPRDDQYWLDTTMDLLRHCDAAYRLDGFSLGGDAEEEECGRLGLQVFRSMSSLACWVEQWRGRHATAR